MPEPARSRRFCTRCGAEYLSALVHCPKDGAEIRESDRDPLIEKVLGSRYHLVERIGEGGMGRVYRATHVELGRNFAVKVLVGEMSANNDAVERFRREARALSRLSHPHIVSVVDFGTTDTGLLYLVVDYVEGLSLRQVLARGPLSWSRVHRVCVQVLRALRHAHEKGLIHRDLKPDNVMLVDEEGSLDAVRVLDFGIARLHQDNESLSQRFTTDGVVLGTPAYMAPEQAKGGVISELTDLYSLGVMLHELVTGRLPFVARSPLEMISHHIMTEPTPPQAPGLPGEAALFIHRLMAKEPGDRAIDVAEALARWQALPLGPGAGGSIETVRDAIPPVGPGAAPGQATVAVQGAAPIPQTPRHGLLGGTRHLGGDASRHRSTPPIAVTAHTQTGSALPQPMALVGGGTTSTEEALAPAANVESPAGPLQVSTQPHGDAASSGAPFSAVVGNRDTAAATAALDPVRVEDPGPADDLTILRPSRRWLKIAAVMVGLGTIGIVAWSASSTRPSPAQAKPEQATAHVSDQATARISEQVIVEASAGGEATDAGSGDGTAIAPTTTSRPDAAAEPSFRAGSGERVSSAPGESGASVAADEAASRSVRSPRARKPARKKSPKTGAEAPVVTRVVPSLDELKSRLNRVSSLIEAAAAQQPKETIRKWQLEWMRLGREFAASDGSVASRKPLSTALRRLELALQRVRP